MTMHYKCPEGKKVAVVGPGGIRSHSGVRKEEQRGWRTSWIQAEQAPGVVAE